MLGDKGNFGGSAGASNYAGDGMGGQVNLDHVGGGSGNVLRNIGGKWTIVSRSTGKPVGQGGGQAPIAAPIVRPVTPAVPSLLAPSVPLDPQIMGRLQQALAPKATGLAGASAGVLSGAGASASAYPNSMPGNSNVGLQYGAGTVNAVPRATGGLLGNMNPPHSLTPRTAGTTYQGEGMPGGWGQQAFEGGPAAPSSLGMQAPGNMNPPHTPTPNRDGFIQSPFSNPMRYIPGTPGANAATSGEYLAQNFGKTDVEDLTRPDLANPNMQTGDWTFNAETGVKTPVYNAIAQGAIPTPRISPLKQSPVMRTPNGDVALWNPTGNYKPPTTPAAQAMQRDMQLAAFNTGTLVQPFSGLAGRATTKNHPSGNAIDVNIMDPATGKALPNFQNAGSYPAYERYAQAVRAQQQALNPELNDALRWGGYFSNRGNPTGGMAADQMHFDVSPQFGGAMAGGSWEGGPTPQMAAVWGGTGPNQPPSAYTTAMNNPPNNVSPATAAPQTMADNAPSLWESLMPTSLKDKAAQAAELVKAGYATYTDANKKIEKYGGAENVVRLAKMAEAIRNFMPGGPGNRGATKNTDQRGQGFYKKDDKGKGTDTPATPPVTPPTVNPTPPMWYYPQYTQAWANLPTGLGGPVWKPTPPSAGLFATKDETKDKRKKRGAVA